MVQPKGTITGFDLSVSRDGPNTVTICALPGRVHNPDWFSTRYCASSASIRTDVTARRVRVFIVDDDMYGRSFSDVASSHLVVDDDVSTPPGLYPGGLIVLGCIDIPAWELEMTATLVEKPLDPRERESMLRIIRALYAMTNLQERSAVSDVLHKLEEIGFINRPGNSTIRKVLKLARALEPDGKPQ